MKQNTEKINVSLPKDTLEIADSNRAKFGFKTRSEFIDAAIREYVSRSIMREFSGELAHLYTRISRSEIKDLEEHLSKLSYKIAVELAQINLLLVSAMDLDWMDTSKLRGEAVKLVKGSRGYIPLNVARKNQVELKPDMDIEDMAPINLYQTEIRDTLFSVSYEGAGVDEETMNKILKAIDYTVVMLKDKKERNKL